MIDTLSMVIAVEHDEDSAEQVEEAVSRLRRELVAEDAVQSIEPVLYSTKNAQATKSAALAAVVGAFRAVVEAPAAAAVVTNVWQTFKGRKISIDFEKHGTKLKVTVSNTEELAAVIETLNKLE